MSTILNDLDFVQRLCNPKQVSSILFKSFAGIDPTGELDAKTVDLMNTPRCGVKDTVGLDEEDRDEDDTR